MMLVPMRYAVWISVEYIRPIQKGTHCVHKKKQLFMLQQENKDKEANPLTQNYQNTLNLIYLSEALYLSNIGATEKPCDKGT